MFQCDVNYVKQLVAQTLPPCESFPLEYLSLDTKKINLLLPSLLNARQIIFVVVLLCVRCHVFQQDEVRSSTDDWSALGMHGNQSSPVVCEALLTPDRLIGSFGKVSNNLLRGLHKVCSCCGSILSLVQILFALFWL